MDEFIRSLWERVVERSDDFFRVAVLPSLVGLVVFYSLNAILLFFHFFPSFSPIEKYKIQPNKHEKTTKVAWMLLNILFNHSMALLSSIASYKTYKNLGFSSDTSSIPPWHHILFQLAFCMVAYDFFFYFSHRLMHTQWLFQHIHYVHHSSFLSMGITQSYFHPVDFWVTTLSATVPIFLITRHSLVWALWMVVLDVESILVHSGYYFPGLPDSRIHYLHHCPRGFKSNFGSFFGIWDRLLGTHKEY
uniref:Fatty acid hydroxylase domain-containing protein n=1 Tax=Arcella intermedia TaxID=1963864 RepID=A0A6B2LFE1_9EUKA